jgi:hypothetical protein
MNEYVKFLNRHQNKYIEYITNKDAEGLWSFLTLDNDDSYDIRGALAAILNYFESISIGIEEELIDEVFVKRFFKTIFVNYKEKYEFYIKFRQSENENAKDAWSHFIALV